MRSKYIVIEGLEGAGKTTARNVVVETLEQLGIRDIVFTREPGGTQLAEKLRMETRCQPNDRTKSGQTTERRYVSNSVKNERVCQ